MRILTLRLRPRKVTLFMSLRNKTTKLQGQLFNPRLNIHFRGSNKMGGPTQTCMLGDQFWSESDYGQNLQEDMIAAFNFTLCNMCWPDKCQVIQDAAMAQLHPYVCHQGQESANVLCRNHQSCRKASRTLTSSESWIVPKAANSWIGLKTANSEFRTEHFGSEML